MGGGDQFFLKKDKRGTIFSSTKFQGPGEISTCQPQPLPLPLPYSFCSPLRHKKNIKIDAHFLQHGHSAEEETKFSTFYVGGSPTSKYLVTGLRADSGKKSQEQAESYSPWRNKKITMPKPREHQQTKVWSRGCKITAASHGVPPRSLSLRGALIM